MKTITLTVTDDAKITVDGVEYAPKGTNAKTPERELWTPTYTESYWFLTQTGFTIPQIYTDYEQHQPRLTAGNVFPTREHAEAAKRHREAQSVIDRYCYAKGIDTRWKEGVTKWTVRLDDGVLVVSYYSALCQGNPFHVESKEIAEQIIADCGDEIRTVLLRGWTE